MMFQKDDKNSSSCWIAFVQRYNFPFQVLKGGELVKSISDVASLSNFVQSMEVETNNEGLYQLVTVGISGDPESGDPRFASPIDFSTMEHVQCCGHQVFMPSASYGIFFVNVYYAPEMDVLCRVVGTVCHYVILYY